MSEARMNQEHEQGGALFGWSHEFLVDRFTQLLEQQEEWDRGLSLDSAAMQRELTCVDMQPNSLNISVDPLSRPILFHRLIGEIYLELMIDGINPADTTVREVRLLLQDSELSAESSFYLEVEDVLSGSKSLATKIANAIRLLASGLDFFQVISGTRLGPPLPTEFDNISINSPEIGVLRGITRESENFVVPGDSLVFTQNARKIQLGSKGNVISFTRRLFESDVLVSVAKHFLHTGTPPESVIVVDLSTGEAEQRVLNPSSFVRSLDMVSSGFANALKKKRSEIVPRREGMWCGACELLPNCSVGGSRKKFRIDRDDEEEQ